MCDVAARGGGLCGACGGAERGPRAGAETRSERCARGAALAGEWAAARLRGRRSVSPHTGGSAAPRSAALR